MLILKGFVDSADALDAIPVEPVGAPVWGCWRRRGGRCGVDRWRLGGVSPTRKGLRWSRRGFLWHCGNWWCDGESSLNRTGLSDRIGPQRLRKTGHYRGRRGGGWSWGGGGWDEVVVVLADGIVDGLTPAVGAEGFDVFVLGEADGLEKSLGQVGHGAGGLGFYIAANDGGDEAGEGGTEIVGGEVVGGKEVGQVLADGFGGAGEGFFLGVVEAEVGMVAGARGAATAAIGESE